MARAGLTTHPPEDGQIETVFALSLPPQPLALRGFVGLRDGHQSQGVGFRVKVSERELWRWDSGPAAATWQPFSVDLSQYAGRSVILSLVADSLGSYAFDWASWGDVGFAPLP
ncbi:MAG: NPCBM/NEW2 domain-containing protein [Armatimonadetes bacterium]|nr:NPCBM/NEW2 domain-containing protein [Armatimonadota bacterium]